MSGGVSRFRPGFMLRIPNADECGRRDPVLVPVMERIAIDVAPALGWTRAGRRAQQDAERPPVS